jgi:hypothetical protein
VAPSPSAHDHRGEALSRARELKCLRLDEHTSSALLPNPDIARPGQHVSNVPEPDSCTAANRYNVLFDHLVGVHKERLGDHPPHRLSPSSGWRAATTNSGVSVTLALIEFAMKQWASTLSMILRAGSSSTSFLRVT